MRILDIPRYSIVMLIGPSNSGKSYFAKTKLLPFLHGSRVNVKYLSSDDARRDMIGDDNRHKHGSGMQAVSKQAFDLLHTKLDLYTQYPVNTDVVVVDATHLSKIARAKILEIAKKNAYGVVGIMFDYKDMNDYVKYLDDATQKKVIYDMVKTLRKQTSKEIDKSDFASFYKIESIDFEDITVTYSEGNFGAKVNHDNVCFVGDLHGCYDEFIELLNDKKGMRIDGETMEIIVEPGAIENNSYVHHVLIGDVVDKGPHEGVRKLVEFLAKNRKHFTIVEGNHDRWVYKYLKGQIKKSKDTETLIESWFDSVRLFEQDEELKKKFLALYESMYTYAYSDRFVATHAPCENKYLKKEDKVSLKKMNTCMYPKKADYSTEEEWLNAREEYFSYLLREGEVNQPIHVFGHVAQSSFFQSKNKYGIDTGCVSGYFLTGLSLMKENRKPFARKYKSKQPQKESLIPLFRVKASEIDIHGLEPLLQKRLQWCAKNQVNFVSGTMSPCDKYQGDLESLIAGVNYYRSKGMNRIMLQPKFMGSRCNILLHRTSVEKTRVLSRNAYEIKQERLFTEDKLSDMLHFLQQKYRSLFERFDAEYILFDGELLPWNVMGKDLIERDFLLPYQACSAELETLKNTGFEDLLADFDNKYGSIEFNSEEYKKLKAHEKGFVKAYNGYVEVNGDGEVKHDGFKYDILHSDIASQSLNKYKRQLDIFNAKGPLEYSPFSILKIVKRDGTEENWVSSSKTNSEIYDTLLRKDLWMTLDFDVENDGSGKFAATMSLNREDDCVVMTSLEIALETFWKHVTQFKEMEGVVLKPDIVYTPGVAPFLKCRNKEYLRLTYGFDYDALPVKTQRLYSTKSIRRKMETSVKEWELGRELLEVPLMEVSTENKKWLSYAVQLLSEQDKEKDLDPRL